MESEFPLPSEILINQEWPGGISDGLTLPCQLCGRVPNFDYHVTDEFWDEIVTDTLRRGVICLPCLDVVASAIGLNVAQNLTQIQFTGHRKTVVFVPTEIYYYSKEKNER